MITDLIPAPYRLAAAAIVCALLAAAGFCAGWKVQGWRQASAVEQLRAQHAEALQAAAEAARKASDDARAREAALTDQLEAVTREAQAISERAAADAAAADAARSSMLNAARLRAGGCRAPGADPAAASGGKTADTSGAVLFDVLARADAAAGELAAHADRARAAGLACERAYDAARAAISSR